MPDLLQELSSAFARIQSSDHVRETPTSSLYGTWSLLLSAFNAEVVDRRLFRSTGYFSRKQAVFHI